MRTASIRRPVTKTRVRAVRAGRVLDRPDDVVTEQPMEIRVHGPGQTPEALAVTMRTPGNDFELAVGFCRTEGILQSADDLASVAYCLEEGDAGDDVHQEYNVVTVRLRARVDLDGRRRTFVANSSCGLCGKASIDQLEVACAPIPAGPPVVRSVLVSLPERLRDAQAVFDATGGLHASARFSFDGDLLALREDVGRHNALDKIVGHALLQRELPLRDDLLTVSGRVSFEIVQKAAVAGVPIVCAVSAPSSLAVEAADRLGQTLIGFLRDDRFNVYSHPERVDVER
ncbi:MAG TPA: formate dehydrogenase accessory sulfurtransferase FdhD [Acidimicrobiia bacterium]